jgi:hypothetical protein
MLKLDVQYCDKLRDEIARHLETLNDVGNENLAMKAEIQRLAADLNVVQLNRDAFAEESARFQVEIARLTKLYEIGLDDRELMVHVHEETKRENAALKRVFREALDILGENVIDDTEEDREWWLRMDKKLCEGINQ